MSKMFTFSGFSSAKSTWLPVNPSYPEINVENELLDENSALNAYKSVLQIRRNHEDLVLWGKTTIKDKVKLRQDL